MGPDKLLVQQLERPTKTERTNPPSMTTAGPSDRRAIALHCFDLRDGSQLWRREGYRLLTVLSPVQCLVLDGSGDLATLHADGRTRGRRAGIANPSVIFGDCEHVVLVAAGRTHVLDHTLQLHEELRWQPPGEDLRQRYWYSRRRHFWVEGNTLMTFDGRSRTEVFCTMDPAIAAALDLQDPSLVERSFVRKDGDRYVFMADWWKQFDGSRREVVLGNPLGPHIAICVDESGVARWCSYLSPQCCGDIPQRLPNGNYLAHSGCGMELIWLDPRGRIIVRTPRRRGRPRVLSDGRVLVTELDDWLRCRALLLYDMDGNALACPASSVPASWYAPGPYDVHQTERGSSTTLDVRALAP